MLVVGVSLVSIIFSDRYYWYPPPPPPAPQCWRRVCAQDSASVPCAPPSPGHPASQGAQDRNPGRHCVRLIHPKHCDGHPAAPVHVQCYWCPTVQGEPSHRPHGIQGKLFMCTDLSKTSEKECQGEYITYINSDVNKPTVTSHLISL